MLHCVVIIVTDAGTSTGDLGSKLIPKSNTTDNMMNMIIDLLSLMISYSSFLGNLLNDCHLYKVITPTHLRIKCTS